MFNSLAALCKTSMQTYSFFQNCLVLDSTILHGKCLGTLKSFLMDQFAGKLPVFSSIGHLLSCADCSSSRVKTSTTPRWSLAKGGFSSIARNTQQQLLKAKFYEYFQVGSRRSLSREFRRGAWD